MKRSSSIVIGVSLSILALGAMAAVAGPILYPNASASTASMVPSVLPTVHEEPSRVVFDDIAQLSGEWEITDGSSAGYTVGAVVNGSSLAVSGTTDDVAGSATVDDGMLIRATIVVEVASISTDNATRDAYFRGPALDCADYPTASFTLSSPVALSDALVAGQPMLVAASGELSLHGVSRPVDVSLTARLQNGRLTLAGSVPVTFDDYGVAAIDLGYVRVDDDGSIDFTFEVAPR
ncbi:YceI family protein [Agreia sp.]|uniref:YceI family protein n=1 Tax=Agreia sp. TaxID=1872416 RepID=UPI0035BC3D02